MKMFRRIFAGAISLLAVTMAALGCMVTQPFVRKVPVALPAKSFSPDTLKHFVEAITSEPHHYPDVARLGVIAADIHAHLARLDGAQLSQQTYVVKDNVYRNVGVLFGNPNERIIVGAHYDAAGPFPGADDDASGIAVMLQVARAMAEEKPAFLAHVGVEFVAYSLEEEPRFRGPEMGSARHAQFLRDNHVRVRAMMSLEMVGYFSDEPGSQTFPIKPLSWFYPTTGNYIALVGKLGQGDIVRVAKGAFMAASDLPVYSVNAPRAIPGVDFSDHQSYWNRNFPAFMVTDTAFYRNRNYHTENDLPDTLDYEKMSKVAAGVYAAVVALATR